jgi:hypothetical protein
LEAFANSRVDADAPVLADGAAKILAKVFENQEIKELLNRTGIMPWILASLPVLLWIAGAPAGLTAATASTAAMIIALRK